MQSIVTPLQAVLTATTRQIRASVKASWLKIQDPNINFAIVGSSVVGSTDLVQGTNAAITDADLYDYMDESEHAMQIDYDRRIDEPRGGISLAIATVLFDNITGRFTPNKNATIGTALEARRPFKMSIGFLAGGVERDAQVIVGLTSKRPTLGRTNRTTEVEVFDYITFINNATLAAAIYENKRSDEIIESILNDLGFGSSQYMLDTGLNTIPFAWFDKEKSAGARIKQICEAEEAHFYQDENGILRFENRNHYLTYPHQNVQRTIDAGDILTDEDDASTSIINRAIVAAKPRQVDTNPSVLWSNPDKPLLGPGETIVIWAAFYDQEAGANVLPVKEITGPDAVTDYLGNSQANGGGVDMTGSLLVIPTNFVESAKVIVTNSHPTDSLYLTFLQLRGKAARVTQAIQAVSEDADSINKFEAQEYTISNDLIQSSIVAKIIADNLVDKYANPMGRRKVRIPGIPHLQLKDLLYVVNPDAENLITNPSFEVNTDDWSVANHGSLTPTLSRARDVPIPDGYFAGKISIA